MKKITKRTAVILSVVTFFCTFIAGLEISFASWKKRGTWSPDYEKMDISQILIKTELTDEEYEILYAQTGLTKLGVDGLLKNYRVDIILEIQNRYFASNSITYDPILPYVAVGALDGYGTLCALEDGDIILSASTSVAGIRVGHAALVVDGKNSTVLESFQIGYDSDFADAVTETEMSTYMVLRPTGIPEEIIKSVVEYAKNELVGLPYNQIVGLIPKKYQEEITSTQCSHLCWYAYKKFGYDIDSTGGIFVSPKDIANSSYFEVVQIFGFDPERLWK